MIARNMSAARWLPEVETFFTSLENNLQRAVKVIRINCDGNSSHYWLSRLENYEELLSLFYARTYEANSSMETLLTLTADLQREVRTLKIQFSRVSLRAAE